jgi:hypothetical protein
MSSLSQATLLRNKLGQILESSELDDLLLTLKELVQTILPTDAAIAKPTKPERPLQPPNKPALDATSMPIDHTWPRLSGHQGDS